MKRKQYIKLLEGQGACSKAIEWSQRFATSQQAWDACEHGDWMAWVQGKMAGPPGSTSRKKLGLAVCECARMEWRSMSKEEKHAVEIAEQYARGENNLTLRDVLTAACAAAQTTTCVSADAACLAAYAAYTADAAEVATYVVTYVARAAGGNIRFDAAATARAATYTGRAATYTAALKQCAEIFRKHYPKLIVVERQGRCTRTGRGRYATSAQMRACRFL